VHSERETLEVRAREHELNGLQFWLALPPEKAEIDPAFQHVKKHQLPHRYQGNTMMRLVAGEAYGMTSPVRSHAPMFFIEVVRQPPVPHRYEGDAARRLVAGERYPSAAAGRSHAPVLCIDVVTEERESITLPSATQRPALYLQAPSIRISGEEFKAGACVLLD